MNYPLNVLNLNLASLLGTADLGEPLQFDFSGRNPDLWEMDVQDQQAFQRYVDHHLEQSGRQWGIAGYLEKRDSLLRDLPQMVSEQRFFHLGVDIILPRGAELFLPLEGVVEQIGYEEGKGNFGGFVLVRHEVSETSSGGAAGADGRHSASVFYSLWGHLEKASLPAEGTVLQRGQRLARLGEFSENGDWFYHTHLQILTERGLAEGFISKGYCTTERLATIDQLCPSPLFLLRW